MKKLFLICLTALTLGAFSSCGGDDNGGGEKSTGTHSVTLTTDGNGTAVADPANGADAGAIVTLTAMGNEGMVLDRWEVVSGDIATIRLYNNPTTFIMPDGNVELKAYFGAPNAVDPGMLINGVTWATRNVNTPGTFAEPGEPGLFYQFGQKIAWSISDRATSVPEGSPWLVEIQSDGWKPENDPCPAGWRIPSWADANALGDTDKVNRSMTAGGMTFTDDANRNNSIALPLVGFRIASGGATEAGNYISYWLSEVSSPTNAFHIRGRMGGINTIEMGWSSQMQMGMSIRCVRK